MKRIRQFLYEPEDIVTTEEINCEIDKIVFSKWFNFKKWFLNLLRVK
jgi:hypothetical protein